MIRRLKICTAVLSFALLCGTPSAWAQMNAGPDSSIVDTAQNVASPPAAVDSLPAAPAPADSVRRDTVSQAGAAAADSVASDSVPQVLVTPMATDSTMPALRPETVSVADSLAPRVPPSLPAPARADTVAAGTKQAQGPPPPPGTSGGDRAGTCVLVVHDLDNDTHPDVAVGLPGADRDVVNSGAVLLLGGRRGDTLGEIKGEGPGDAFGASLAQMGDISGDGTPDFAIGAPYADGDSSRPDQGKVYLYSGSTRDLLWTLSGDRAEALLGSVLAGLGDTDGDGTPDLAVALSPLPGDSVSGPGPSVWIVSGKDGRVLQRLRSEQNADRFGAALASAGDVDGDGSADLLVGACRYSAGAQLSTGAVYIISGRTGTTVRRIVGRAMFEQFGYAVAGGKDLNGDGTPDLAVGARFLDQEGGRRGGVYYFSGRDGAHLATVAGQKPGQQFGSALAFVADLDSDGRGDLLVGAPGMTHGESSEGVYRVSSGSGTVIFTALATQAGSRFGSAVAELGDIDGDGRPEVVAGAPYHSKGGQFAGAVQVVSGGTGEVIWSCFGVSSLRAGDTNRVAPLMSLDQLKKEVGGHSFPVYDSNEVDASPIIRRSTAATYPPSAVGTGATGWVKVKVLVLPDGSAAESEVIDLAGLSPEFGEASLAAVRDWSFLPASREGVEVACWAVFPIGFAPPLPPDEQRRVDSIAALDSVSSLVFDTASSMPQALPTDSVAGGVGFYELNQVDVAPVLTARVEPEYPPPALLSREECTVYIRVLVNGQGTVADVQVGEVTVRGKGFETAAVTAVGKWRYEPAVKDGVKVAAWVPEEVRFTPPTGED